MKKFLETPDTDAEEIYVKAYKGNMPFCLGSIPWLVVEIG